LSEERARFVAPTVTVKILKENRRFMVLSRPEKQLSRINPVALVAPDTIVADASIEWRGGN
jgi:hypothetical protein